MRLPDRIFKVGRAAVWLTEMGVSTGKAESLESTIYGRMNVRDDFRKTGKGYAQFIGHGEFGGGEIIPFEAKAVN